MSEIIHDNPADYGLTKREANSLRRQYLDRHKEAARDVWRRWSMTKEELAAEETKYNNKLINHFKKIWKRLAVLAALEYDKNRREFSLIIMSECEDSIKKLERRTNFIEHKEEILARSDAFDIGYLKSIPIDWFVDITPAGFFKIRNEKTPSCKWYKEDNTWVDFGGDNKKHDVIDLIMALRDIDFREACKFLSNK